MNMNNWVNNLSLKKIGIIILLIMAASWLIHEYIFWSYFKKFEQTMSQFNDQFNQDRQRIHNTIVESEVDTDKWRKRFDERSEKFHEEVDKRMKQHDEFMNNSYDRMMERGAAFDKAFAEMPDKMWEAHMNFGRKMAETADERGKRFDAMVSKGWDEREKRHKLRESEYKRKVEAEQKINWEVGRRRYLEEHGVELPTWDELEQQKKERTKAIEKEREEAMAALKKEAIKEEKKEG